MLSWFSGFKGLLAIKRPFLSISQLPFTDQLTSFYASAIKRLYDKRHTGLIFF